MVQRHSESHKRWLADIAQRRLVQDDEVLSGFIKYYVLQGYDMKGLEDDITFETDYGMEGVNAAMERLTHVLEKAAGA